MRSHSESFPYCLVKISEFMHFDNAQYINLYNPMFAYFPVFPCTKSRTSKA